MAAVLASFTVFWGRFTAPPTPDVAWLLYAADLLRKGGTLGVDVVDITPPTIFWMKIPVLAAGSVIGLTPWAAWVTALVIMSLGSAWLIYRIAKSAQYGVWVAMLAAGLFLLLPGRHFGQREHVTLVLSVPWLIAVARRLEGYPARGLSLWLAVLLAAAGLGLKPHFGLTWIAVAALLLVRTGSSRTLFIPELLGVAAFLVVEVVVVGLYAPSYFSLLADYGRDYMGFLTVPIWQALFIGVGPAAVLFAVLARIALRSARGREWEGSAVLSAGAIGFWLAAGLQVKGWQYHYLPAESTALLAVGALLAETSGTALGKVARTYRAAGVGALVAGLLTPVAHTALQVTRLERPYFSDLDANLDLLLPIVRAAAREGSVFVFSTNIASDFPLVSEAGAQWAFRQGGLGLLGAMYSAQLDGLGAVHPRPLSRRTAGEHKLAKDLVADLRRYRPAAMLVLDQNGTELGGGGAFRFDYLSYFLADQAFAEVFAGYRYDATVGDYSLYVRKGVSLAPFPKASQTVVRGPGAPGPQGNGVGLHFVPVAILLLLLGFGARIVADQRP